jgi:hypothetical protein
VARAAGLLTVAVLTVSLTACGSSKKPAATTTASENAAPAVRDAVAKTVRAGSEHAVLSAAVNAGGNAVRLAGKGDFDSAKRTGSLHASFAVGGLQSTVDEVLDGQTVYVSSPFFSTVLPAGKTWLKLDLATAEKTLGANASALTSQDPTAALGQLRALTGLRQTGTATIDGVQTTRYRGRIDPSRLPAATRSLVAKSGTGFGPVDVWVGADGYVHRVRVATTAGAGGQKARTVVTMTLSKYGEPVQTSVPPATATVDASTVKIPGLGG